MLRQKLFKWGAISSAMAFAVIPGCEELTGVTDIVEQLLGLVGVA